MQVQALGDALRADTEPDSSALLNSLSSDASSRSTATGMAKLVHRGTAQALCTRSAGTKNEAAARPSAASQGQKTIKPEMRQIARMIGFFVQRDRRWRTMSKTAGNKRT